MRGDQLKAMRSDSGFRASEIAEELGVTPQTWSRYENNRARIPKAIVLATKYVCEKKLRKPSAGDRIIDAMLEAIYENQHAAANARK